VDSGKRPIAVPGHERCQFRVERIGGKVRAPGTEPRDRPRQRARVSPGARGCGALGSDLDQRDPDLKLDRDVLSGIQALAEVAGPGVETVHPRLDRVRVPAQLGHPKLGPEAIVAERLHGHLDPCCGRLPTMQQHRADEIVPIGHDLGLHHDPVADDALDREPTAVHHGRELRDRDPAPAVDPCHLGASSLPVLLIARRAACRTGRASGARSRPS
jgi:hypothetical protein